MADQKPDSKSPLSIPLDKGEVARGSFAKNQPDSSRDFGAERSRPSTVIVGVKFWKIIVAMFLFPFFFHAGSELYHVARAAIVANMGGKKPVEAKPEPDSGKQAELKTLEKLTTILEAQTKALEEGAGKVVVIHPSAAFSFDAEKAKIYELSGINLDDPPGGANKLEKVKSVELLHSLMESFDRIMNNAAANNISDFHVKNAIEWKKRALKRLQEIR